MGLSVNNAFAFNHKKVHKSYSLLTTQYPIAIPLQFKCHPIIFKIKESILLFLSLL